MSIRTCLLLCGLLLTSVAWGQTDTTVHAADSTSRNLSRKEERKYQDSLIKNMAPIQDKAIVYIVRRGMMGAAIPFRLDCDSINIGWIGSGTFLYTILDPGVHMFKAQSENEFTLPMTLEPGKIYFLDEPARMGVMYAETKLKVLDEKEGRKSLDKCHLSKHNRYPKVVLVKDTGTSPSDN
jgi:hypothetical protein